MNKYIPGIGNGQLCDAACWSSETFGSTNSVHANFYEASYGTVSFTSSGSMRVVVNMNVALTSLATGTCPVDAESQKALESPAFCELGALTMFVLYCFGGLGGQKVVESPVFLKAKAAKLFAL